MQKKIDALNVARNNDIYLSAKSSELISGELAGVENKVFC